MKRYRFKNPNKFAALAPSIRTNLVNYGVDKIVRATFIAERDALYALIDRKSL